MLLIFVNYDIINELVDHLDIVFYVPLTVNQEAFDERYAEITPLEGQAARPRLKWTNSSRIGQIPHLPGEQWPSREVEKGDFNIDDSHYHPNRPFVEVTVNIPSHLLKPQKARPKDQAIFTFKVERGEDWLEIRQIIHDAIDTAIAEWKEQASPEGHNDIEFSSIEGGGIGERKGKWGLLVPRSDFEFNLEYDITNFQVFVRKTIN